MKDPDKAKLLVYLKRVDDFLALSSSEENDQFDENIITSMREQGKKFQDKLINSYALSTGVIMSIPRGPEISMLVIGEEHHKVVSMMTKTAYAEIFPREKLDPTKSFVENHLPDMNKSILYDLKITIKTKPILTGPEERRLRRKNDRK